MTSRGKLLSDVLISIWVVGVIAIAFVVAVSGAA